VTSLASLVAGYFIFPKSAADGDVPADIPLAGITEAEMPVAEMPVAEMPVAEMPIAGIPIAGIPIAGIPIAGIPRAATSWAAVRLATSGSNDRDSHREPEGAVRVGKREYEGIGPPHAEHGR
jgi:hypothetical protein